MTSDRKRNYLKKRRKESFDFLIQQKILRGSCEDCGLIFDPIFSFMFHWAHRDPAEKRRDVSAMAGYAFETILKEIEKCRLLCKDCHLLETLANNHIRYRRNEDQSNIFDKFDQLELDL